MASHFTAQTLAQARDYVASARKNLDRFKAHASKKTSQLFGVIETPGTAGLLGYANGRWGGEAGAIHVGPVPVDLAVGVALHMTSFVGGIDEKHEEHIENLGNGALAAVAYRSAAKLGQKHAHEAQAKAQQGVLPAAAAVAAALPPAVAAQLAAQGIAPYAAVPKTGG